MLLHQIIKLNNEILTGQSTACISFDDLLPYKKSLLAYYQNKWPRSQVIFVATFVTNACCAGLLAPSNELSDVFDMLTCDIDNEEDRDAEIELLGYQSQKFC